MSRAITSALMVVAALSLSGCDKKIVEPLVETSNGAGGIIRFAVSEYKSSSIFGGIEGLVRKAGYTCASRDAVSTGFYTIPSDEEGRDQVMTFECK